MEGPSYPTTTNLWSLKIKCAQRRLRGAPASRGQAHGREPARGTRGRRWAHFIFKDRKFVGHWAPPDLCAHTLHLFRASPLPPDDGRAAQRVAVDIQGGFKQFTERFVGQHFGCVIAGSEEPV